jgi:hypothetical protein
MVRGMRNLLVSVCVVSFSLPAWAQVHVDINVPLPSVRFEAAPPLVVVEPGIQVVPQQEEEVFFTDGYYWTRRDGRWFRSRDHRGGWAVMEERRVPPGLARMPPGKYRHWRAEERREERREDRREERREDKRERHEDHDGDRGEHRGHDHDRDEH